MDNHETMMRRIHLGELVVSIALVLVLLGLSVALSGCMDVAQWQLRTFYGLDCRPEKLVNGHCVPVTQAAPDNATPAPAQQADKK